MHFGLRRPIRLIFHCIDKYIPLPPLACNRVIISCVQYSSFSYKNSRICGTDHNSCASTGTTTAIFSYCTELSTAATVSAAAATIMHAPAVLLIGLTAVLSLSAAEQFNFVRTGDCEVRLNARAQCLTH